MGTRNVVVLSDIHIGDNSPTCWYQDTIHEKYLLAIFDWIIANAQDVAELVLLGDVVDMWTYPFDTPPPTFATIAGRNQAVFGPSGGLARVLDALDGAVTYVPGNHDMAVTAADAASITSPNGHHLRFCDGTYAPGGAARVVTMHGNEFTLFNAPDPATQWAPLPIGHFITRIIATHWQAELKTGQNVAELPGQGYPNGLDWASVVSGVVWSADVSIADILIDGVAGKEGVSTSASIQLADGTQTTLTEVKSAYRDLFTHWVSNNGGGEDGLLVAIKAALADYNASYMGWFAQREAFRAGAQLVVMGHTHEPISGLGGSLITYVNAGFECPSEPDMPPRTVSFVVVDMDTGTAEVKQISDVTGSMVVGPCPAPTASIVKSPFEDFSCYVVIDNSAFGEDLLLQGTRVGHGHFVTLPQTIPAGGKATLWLQDYPNLLPPHGSDAVVTYRTGTGLEFVFTFDCPTGVYPNSCSGGTSFRAKAGHGDWLPPGQVPNSGHPLFVEFTVTAAGANGSFVGGCGENSSAVSAAGLQPTQAVVLNGTKDLSSCILANDDACVFGITLEPSSGIYAYTLSVDARGPKGAFSGSMYLHFTDQTGDRYLLTVFDSSRKTHTVGYNSAAPAIVKIEWSNHAG